MKNFPPLYQLGIRFPKTVLLVSFLVTLASLFAVRHLRVESDLTVLLPRENENVKNFFQLKEHFGGMGHLVVTVEAEDPLVAEEFAEDLAARIEKHPAIYYVDFHAPQDFFKKRQWLYLDREDLQEMEHRVDRALELHRKGVSPILSKWIGLADAEDRPDLEFKDILRKYEKRYLGSQGSPSDSEEKGKLLVLWVKAKEHPQNLEASRRLVSDIRDLERETKQNPRYRSVQVGYTGDYETSLEQADFTRREITWVSLVVFVLLLLILFLFFRRASAIFLVGIPLALGIVWTGGVVSLLLGHLNVLTGFAAGILAGLGSDYGIYLLSRYYRERELGRDFQSACLLAFSNTGKATFACMVTTVAAFFSLLFSDFGFFKEFGIVGATGLLLNYLAMMLVMPGLLAWAENSKWKLISLPRPAASRESRNWVFTLSSTLFNIKAPWAGVILALFLCGIAAFSLPAQSKIYFEDAQMQAHELPGNRLNNRVIRQEGIYSSPTILIHTSAEDEGKTVRRLDSLLKRSPPGSLVFEKVLGLTSFIPSAQEEKKALLQRISEKFEKIPLFLKKKKEGFLTSLKDSIEADLITKEGLPKEIRHRFESVRNKEVYAVFLYSAIVRETNEQMGRYHDGVKTFLTEEGLSFIPVDSNFITHDVVSLIEREAPRGLFLIMLFLTGFVFLTIRPWGRALILLANLFGSLVLLSGALWLFHIPLNVMNVVVFPIILGTGIDCFIHFNHRYNETRDLPEALRKLVPSILVSNLTTIVGFGGLILTASAGLRSIGWVALWGLVIVTLLCIFVFPRCLALESSKKKIEMLNLESERSL